MFVRNLGLLGLLLITSATALVSVSSSHHATSTTTKKSTSTLHSSTTKKPTTSPSSTHHISTTTKPTTLTTSTGKISSTAKSSFTPAPSTFYLVAEDTGSTAFDGSYFHTIPDPNPLIVPSGDKVIQFGAKDSKGARTFTVLPDGTLQCNDISGPLYACVDYGHPVVQPLQWEDPKQVGEWGFVAVTCAIAKGFLSCEWGPLNVFLYEGSMVENGTQVGEYVSLGLPEDSKPGNKTLTIKVVPF